MCSVIVQPVVEQTLRSLRIEYPQTQGKQLARQKPVEFHSASQLADTPLK
jgi:hypothetical protein